MTFLHIIATIFVEVDDFCQSFQKEWEATLIETGECQRRREQRLSLSEICAIIISFHQVGFRCFKHYYSWLKQQCGHFFPCLVSYNRFVELMKSAIVPLCMFLTQRCKGKVTGISFIDSTKVQVCGNKRIKANKVFDGLAKTGKTTTVWFHGFKLHIIINDCGELLAFTLTPGNIDDRKPVANMAKNLSGKLFGDKGYISKKLFDQLFAKGVKLITNVRAKMKNSLVEMEEKILLRKRALVETVNDQLKNISQLEHTRHRSITGFMTNILAALIAYSLQPKKPSLKFRDSNDASLQQDKKQDNPVCYPLA